MDCGMGNEEGLKQLFCNKNLDFGHFVAKNTTYAFEDILRKFADKDVPQVVQLCP